ncbi:5929_t:CDS:2, partial [Racocetra fulgida]
GGAMGAMMQDLAFAIPGVDEAMGFPSVLEKALAKIAQLSGRFGPVFQQMSGMMGLNANQEDMFGKLEGMRAIITEVNNQFKDPVHSDCEQCLVRHKMQQKYLDQIYNLYEDFHIVLMPLLTKEIRGTQDIKEFSEMLVKPFAPPDYSMMDDSQ